MDLPSLFYTVSDGRVYSTWRYVWPKVVRQVFLVVSRHGAVRTALPACPAKVGIKKNIVRASDSISLLTEFARDRLPIVARHWKRIHRSVCRSRFAVYGAREHPGTRAGKIMTTRLLQRFRCSSGRRRRVSFYAWTPPPRVFATCAAEMVSRRRRPPVGYQYTQVHAYAIRESDVRGRWILLLLILDFNGLEKTRS